MTADFLVEIGTEELPPKSLKKLEQSFLTGILNQLDQINIHYGETKSFSTPRRLAILIRNTKKFTPEKETEVWGPPTKIAFDDSGLPTKAANAFAKKNSIDVNTLHQHIKNDGKAERLHCSTKTGGKKTTDLLPSIITKSLEELPIEKRMRWGERRTEFVRPAHWVVMLFDNKIVEANILGLNTDHYTYGHRLKGNKGLAIQKIDDYENLLKSANVIVDYEKRKNLIQQQVTKLAKTAGGQAVIDADLLDEVTALVEWPVALFGRFDEKFLEIPQEALVSSMREHQKYFHLVDKNNSLLPGFITIANLESKEPEKVIDGNERVIRPRLSDAAFFFESDKKIRLDKRCEKLKTIVFQQKLGTMYDKALRISKLASYIAETIGANSNIAERGGFLSKADLASDMVLEFDKMQGIAGSYYALNDEEHPSVALAIREHYLPKFSGDTIPSTLESCAVALADRIDTLIGIFGLGQAPTGSKDPFALRRASIACLNIIVHHKLDLDITPLLTYSFGLYESLPAGEHTIAYVNEYILERFRSWFHDDGIPTEVFNSVHVKSLTRPYDIHMRVLAVNAFNQLEEAQALAAANKRVSNILSKAEQVAGDLSINQALFEFEQEKSLALQLEQKRKLIEPLMQKKDYKTALFSLADLRCPVDNFFDHVMVMVDDLNIRKNRLALLQSLQSLFLQVADIAYLVPEKNNG